MRRFVLAVIISSFVTVLHAQRTDDRAALIASIDAKRSSYADVAKQIWGFAEVGYQVTDPTHIQKARAEFDQKRGPDFKYATKLADRKPALDYRR